jgi:hypothetical protein
MVIVSELIEKLKAMPGHLPVMIEFESDSSEGMIGVDYYYTLDAELGGFQTQGRMAVIKINMEPT